MKKTNDKLLLIAAFIIAPISFLIAIAGLQNDSYNITFFISYSLFIASGLTIGMYDREND